MRTKKQNTLSALKYKRTKSGLLNQMYRKQVSRSKERGLPPPSYSFIQLKNKFINDPLYISLFDSWVASGYNKQIIPSIDRTDSTKPYTFNNISMMTWAENRAKQATTDIKNSHYTPVAAIIDMNVIHIFKNLNEAERVTGAHRWNIYSCIRGKRLTAAGYSWKSLIKTPINKIEELVERLPMSISNINFSPVELHKEKGKYKGIKNILL